MERRKIRLCMCLFLGLVLTACKAEEVTEDRAVLSDDAVMVSDNTAMKAENADDMESDDISEERMTVISILGKEELEIESDRIHNLSYRLEQNMDEGDGQKADAILRAVEGIWVVDEYVGFVSYDYYKDGQFAKADTVDENHERYEKDKKRAGTDISGVFLMIKTEDNVSAEAGGPYIYSGDGYTFYESPLRIHISMDKTGDDYSLSSHRTIQGAETDPQYPAIYIEFLSCLYSKEEDRTFYEPVTLILTADGQFLLLRDGGFYTLKHDITYELMSGNMDHVECGESTKVTLEGCIQRSMKGGMYPLEWRWIDLNGDGKDDLILQEKDTVGDSEQHRIVAIFDCFEDRAVCIKTDFNDGTEYSFCGTSGALMYTAPSYGGVVSTDGYEHYHYDSEWNEIPDYTLRAYWIDGDDDKDPISEEWIESHPDMAVNGRYYRRYEENYTQFVNSGAEGPWKGEVLTFQEFKNAYEAATGDRFWSTYFYE